LKIRSSKVDEVPTGTFIHEGKELNDPIEIGNMFSTFFTSLSSTSFATESESDRYLDDHIRKMKLSKTINLKTAGFKFSHTNERIVELLISNLNQASGAGISGIPSKLIKNCCSQFAPVLTKIFNHCIDVGRVPIEWRSAIVTPLYKGKGDIVDFNNYRGISVLPPIAKIFEKILAMQIEIY
jgi:hypothetical protein